MTNRVVEPCSALAGRIHAPGDKSVSHRTGMLAGLAQGVSHIENYLKAEDCLHTLAAVEALGATVERTPEAIRVTGAGGRFRAPAAPLDMGNAGTGMRLLSGLLAGHDFESELTGDASLLSRPMDRIRDPLEQMGASVSLLGDNHCGPIRITGGGLRAVKYHLPVASAQVKGCVLFAGLFADGDTTVVEPRKTRDHTERALQHLGLPVSCDGPRITVHGSLRNGDVLQARDWHVPGDFSSAAFWLAGACRPGSEVTIEGVGLNPRRTAFIDVLLRMGAQIEVVETGTEGGEPTGRLHVTGSALRATTVCGEEIPNLIDELPLVAVAGAVAEGETVIRDAAELRVKESDRIATTAASLRAMGVEVLEKPDGMHIVGGGQVRGNCSVESAGDHRIAMASAILALWADGPVTIRNVDCVATSYPEFWSHLAQLCQA